MTTATNGRHITTREATVRTATVSVKVLTLDKRQVTLSVFRQLINEDLMYWNEDGSMSFAGVPWGTVNYFWPGCGIEDWMSRDPHLHVVWQKGDELRRACVPSARNVAPSHKQSYAMRFRELEDLDQLFIAA